MNIVTESPLDPGRLFDTLQRQNSGSIAFHYAVVKRQAGEKQSSGIRFERAGDPESELSDIEIAVKNRWRIDGILLVRRIGLLQVGDLISLVAVSASASSDAFDACQYGLSRLRKMSSLNKTELFYE